MGNSEWGMGNVVCGGQSADGSSETDFRFPSLGPWVLGSLGISCFVIRHSFVIGYFVITLRSFIFLRKIFLPFSDLGGSVVNQELPPSIVAVNRANVRLAPTGIHYRRSAGLATPVPIA